MSTRQLDGAAQSRRGRETRTARPTNSETSDGDPSAAIPSPISHSSLPVGPGPWQPLPHCPSRLILHYSRTTAPAGSFFDLSGLAGIGRRASLSAFLPRRLAVRLLVRFFPPLIAGVFNRISARSCAACLLLRPSPCHRRKPIKCLEMRMMCRVVRIVVVVDA